MLGLCGGQVLADGGIIKLINVPWLGVCGREVWPRGVYFCCSCDVHLMPRRQAHGERRRVGLRGVRGGEVRIITIGGNSVLQLPRSRELAVRQQLGA